MNDMLLPLPHSGTIPLFHLLLHLCLLVGAAGSTLAFEEKDFPAYHLMVEPFLRYIHAL